MLLTKKRGFTIIELLVVMSIIAILAAALTTQVTKIRETARSMKCKANLKNLAQAAITLGTERSIMPWAGPHERVATSGTEMRASLRPGWVDWTTKGGLIETWDKPYTLGTSSFSSKGTMVTKMAGIPAYLAVTNGSLWGYMGRDLSSYVCEAHKELVKNETKSNEKIYRSYAMNGYFGYNKDFYPEVRRIREVYVNNLADRGSAATLLLFGELSVFQPGVDKDLAVDGVLETVIDGYNNGPDTRSTPQRERLGFCHKVGKQDVAHVAYADGHVDIFYAKASALSVQQHQGLTYFLCNGYDLPKKQAEWVIP